MKAQRTSKKIALSTAALGLLAAGAASCSTLLGLDPPHLDPCVNGCADGGSPLPDASVGDAAPDQATQDATPDQGAVTGVRCGGGTSAAIGCAAPTPACCFTPDDAGAGTYSCQSSSGACGGYPILCATNNDCSGSDVCCHDQSSIKCEKLSVCPSNSLVCEPNGPTDQCPAGWKCSVAFVNDGTTLPYYGCTP